tara:strand:+ start:1474 stop:1689 length:216 start_codon:yes stop_codon:yes gene_type:complete
VKTKGHHKQMGGNSKLTSQRHKERITEKGKICNKCDEDKALDEYGANKSWCLSCIRDYNNARAKKRRYKLW